MCANPLPLITPPHPLPPPHPPCSWMCHCSAPPNTYIHSAYMSRACHHQDSYEKIPLMPLKSRLRLTAWWWLDSGQLCTFCILGVHCTMCTYIHEKAFLCLCNKIWSFLKMKERKFLIIFILIPLKYTEIKTHAFNVSVFREVMNLKRSKEEEKAWIIFKKLKKLNKKVIIGQYAPGQNYMYTAGHLKNKRSTWHLKRREYRKNRKRDMGKDEAI